MIKLIQEYSKVITELNLEELASQKGLNELCFHKSRVKRSINRLIKKVSEGDNYARMRLKTYYKIFKQDFEKTTKIRSNNLIILPYMIGKKVSVYNGKTYTEIKIKPEITGKFFGEFIKTKNVGKHSSKGISAKTMKR